VAGYSIRSPAATWLILVGATLISYTSALEVAGSDRRLAGSAVLLIAFFKVRLIGFRFMELHDAVLPLRLLFETWVLVIASILLAISWQVP